MPHAEVEGAEVGGAAGRTAPTVDVVDVLSGHRLGLVGRTAGGARVLLRHDGDAPPVEGDLFVRAGTFTAVLPLSSVDGMTLADGTWAAHMVEDDGVARPLRTGEEVRLRRPVRVLSADGVVAVTLVTDADALAVQVAPAPAHAELVACRWAGDDLDVVVRPVGQTSGSPVVRARLRGGSDEVDPIAAKDVGDALQVRFAADQLAHVEAGRQVWDLFLDVPGGDETSADGFLGLRVAGHLDGIPDKNTAVHYASRTAGREGAIRLVTPYFTLENGLSVRSEPVPATEPPVRQAVDEASAPDGPTSPPARSPSPPRRARQVRRLLRKRSRQLRRLQGSALTAAAVVLVRRSADRPAGPSGRPRVTVLLLDAYGLGGTIRSVFNVCSELVRWYDVEVLSVRRGRDKPFFDVPPGVRVRTLDDQRPDHRLAGLAGHAQRLLAPRPSRLVDRDDRAHEFVSAWTDVQLRAHLPAARTDVVMGTRVALNAVVCGLAPASAARVGQVHTSFPASPRLRRVIRTTYGRLDALAALSEADLAAYDEALRPSTPRLVRIPNAVTPMLGRRSDTSRPVVVAAGRFAAIKRFDLLITAFAPVVQAHPDWALHLYGGGTTAPLLRERIRELSLHDHVYLMGYTRHLGAELERASVYALSSASEGFPMVLIEAMSKGVPPVAFECSGSVREIVTDGVDGLVVPNGDTESLTAALLRLVEDDDLRRRMGAAAKERSLAFELEAVGQQWRDMIDSVLQTTSERRTRA